MECADVCERERSWRNLECWNRPLNNQMHDFPIRSLAGFAGRSVLQTWIHSQNVPMLWHDDGTISAMSFSASLLLLAAVGTWILLSLFHKKSTLFSVATNPTVSFVFHQYPDWKVLPKSLQAYEVETHRALETLSFAIETLGENAPSLADSLRNKIDRLAVIYDKDLEILKKILTPFPAQYLLELPSSIQSVRNSTTNTANNSHESSDHFTFAPTASPYPQQSSYESVRQVVAHLVRDWSSLGAPIRKPLYEWCVGAVSRYVGGVAKHPILIPGAGLGRLAWDMASQGYRVEAVESSITMAAAAYSIFHHSTVFQLHPYAADPFINEVDSNLRYTTCSVPDTTFATNGTGHLLFSLAQFDDSFVPGKHYAAVVTCFFLDTATTLIDYVSMIQHALVSGGIWINIGPLQWHHNSRVPLAADELKEYLTESFKILHWSVDDTVLNYRDGRSATSPVSTFADGYRPLRFVVQSNVR